MASKNPKSAPKMEQLKAYIRDRIANESLKPHDRLPSRNELISLLGISETTVRKALTALEAENVIYLQQGKGAFVAERKVKCQRIAMLVPTFGGIDRWLTSIVRSAQNEARKHNANMVLYITDSNPEIERSDLLNIVENGADAAVIFYTGGIVNIDCLNLLKEHGIPFVLMDCYESQVDTDYIVSDNFNGAYRAIKLMIEHGYQEIWHFTYANVRSSVTERMCGYKAAMDEIGAYDEHKVVRAPYGLPDYWSVMESKVKEISESSTQRIGIFAVNGIELSAIYHMLSEHNVNLSNFAFACFDTTPIQRPESSLFIQVRQAEDTIGRTCIRLMIEKLTGSTGTRHLILQPEISVINANYEQANSPLSEAAPSLS
ncbi:MAG: GntR family transcriptional regulator [Armatimonadota bacterium]|nr:GntR family transcriptional regulator [bacterium]